MSDLRANATSSLTGSSCGASRPITGSRGSPVMELELCEDLQFIATSGTYEARIVGPVLEGLGPHIEDIVVHARGRAFTASFNYKVELEWSYDGESWAAYELLATTTSGTPIIGNAESDRTKFGRRIRFVISVKGAASETHSGVLSAMVAIRLFS